MFSVMSARHPVHGWRRGDPLYGPRPHTSPRTGHCPLLYTALEPPTPLPFLRTGSWPPTQSHRPSPYLVQDAMFTLSSDKDQKRKKSLSRDGYCCGCYASYWNAFLLPPANEVWGKVIFLHVSVILLTGGSTWVGTPRGRYTPLGRYTPQAGTPPGQVHPLDRYTPWTGTPPRQVHPPGQVHLPPGTPPGNACWDMVNKRMVRILLECILVFNENSIVSVIAELSQRCR